MYEIFRDVTYEGTIRVYKTTKLKINWKGFQKVMPGNMDYF